MNLGIDGLTFVELIGRGGFGSVYRVRDEVHGRDLAVKILPAPLDDSARRQFDRERRAMGVLSGHPNIGVVHTSGFTANDEPYIAMELLRGGALSQRLEEGPLDVDEVLEIGASVADALAVAHDTGVLHLDVKPENILFSDFGTPKLVDFGIAALAEDEKYTSTIRATPAYAAPEILDGHQATAAADIYGLAVTIYALLMGMAPYAGDSMLTVLRRIAVEPVPEVYRADTPPALVDLLRRAMGKRPEDRPATMREFADALRAIDPNDLSPEEAEPQGFGAFLPPPPGEATIAQPTTPAITPHVAHDPAPRTLTGSSAYGPPAGTNGPPPGRPSTNGSGGGKRGLAIGGIVALLAIAGGVVAFVLLGGDDDEEPGSRSVTTRTTIEREPDTSVTPVTAADATPTTVADTTPDTTPVTDPTTPPTTTPTTDVTPSTLVENPGVSISDVRWTLALDENSLPTDTAVVVPDGSPQICLTWQYDGLALDTEWLVNWEIEQEAQPSLDGSGTIVTESDVFFACVTNDQGVIPGTYEMTWTVAGEPTLIDAIYVGGARTPVAVEIVNSSARDFCEAYVSPSAARNWGANKLLGDRVPPGESRIVTVASGAYDTRVVDCDGADVLAEIGGPEILADQQLVVTEP